MVREVQEESNMKVLHLVPIGYQKTTPQIPGEEGVPFYQLRYACLVEPYGPFVSDPAGKVTEVLFVKPEEYKQYFNWGEVSDHLVARAVDCVQHFSNPR